MCGPNPVGPLNEQMVVIFRYSNVIVNRHKFVAHFAFMASILFTHSLSLREFIIISLTLINFIKLIKYEMR